MPLVGRYVSIVKNTGGDGAGGGDVEIEDDERMWIFSCHLMYYYSTHASKIFWVSFSL